MKKVFIISIILITTVCASAQLVKQRRPSRSPYRKTGYIITLNEFTFGAGMASQETPYSKSFFGVTTLLGYQANKTVMVGAATGLLYYYNDGLLIPVYADIRVNLMQDIIVPYLSGSGGILLNPSDLDSGIRTFINPAAGLMYSFKRNFSVNVSVGAFVQMASNTSSANFVNLKAGVTYKF